MPSKKIIIIGCNAAGSTAASAARKTNKQSEITMIESDRYPAYSRCGLPYVLAGQIKAFEDLIVFPLSWYKMMNINLRLETTAKSIEPKEQTVTIEKDGNEETLHYDTLILATGGRSFIPPIKGAEKTGVYGLRTIDDGKRLQASLKEAKSAVIVGAGLIGLESAHAFSEHNIDTTVMEMLPQVCPAMIDWDMARIVEQRIKEHGIKTRVGSTVKEIVGDNKVKGVIAGDKEIPADIVLMATGVRTRTELVRDLGAEVGMTGGLTVSADMTIAVPNIYACGDCVESSKARSLEPMQQEATQSLQAYLSLPSQRSSTLK
jgi:NADH oxidase (H2O2-forming)